MDGYIPNGRGLDIVYTPVYITGAPLLTFDVDTSVSVFETVIRVLGGLLSAHIIASHPMYDLHLLDGERWYSGELLALAENLGNRLLPAFATKTGIPYGTVNLRHGVPKDESTLASIAAAGSLTLEMQTLSYLTGNPVYGMKAREGVTAMVRRASKAGLVGKHIDIVNGRWTEVRSGVGSNSDSFYEYLLKYYELFGDSTAYDMFCKMYHPMRGWSRRGPWYLDVESNAGQALTGVVDGLGAFWPGMQVSLGALSEASWSTNAHQRVWWDYGFFPETFDVQRWAPPAGHLKATYLLRPELVESTYHMYVATKDRSWLGAGRVMLHALEELRTTCGIAAVSEVLTGNTEDAMASFALSETLKYLYMLFDFDDAVAEKRNTTIQQQEVTAAGAMRLGGDSRRPDYGRNQTRILPRAGRVESTATATAGVGSSRPWVLHPHVFTTEAHPLPILNWNRILSSKHHWAAGDQLTDLVRNSRTVNELPAKPVASHSRLVNAVWRVFSALQQSHEKRRSLGTGPDLSDSIWQFSPLDNSRNQIRADASNRIQPRRVGTLQGCDSNVPGLTSAPRGALVVGIASNCSWALGSPYHELAERGIPPAITVVAYEDTWAPCATCVHICPVQPFWAVEGYDPLGTYVDYPMIQGIHRDALHRHMVDDFAGLKPLQQRRLAAELCLEQALPRELKAELQHFTERELLALYTEATGVESGRSRRSGSSARRAAPQPVAMTCPAPWYTGVTGQPSAGRVEPKADMDALRTVIEEHIAQLPEEHHSVRTLSAGILGNFSLLLVGDTLILYAEKSNITVEAANLSGPMVMVSVANGSNFQSATAESDAQSDKGSKMASVKRQPHHHMTFASRFGLSSTCTLQAVPQTSSEPVGVDTLCTPAGFGPSLDEGVLVTAPWQAALPLEACEPLIHPGTGLPAEYVMHWNHSLYSVLHDGTVWGTDVMCEPPRTAEEHGSSIAHPYCGKVVVVKRGGCMFEEKIRYAAAVGARAVVIVDRDGTAGGSTGSAEEMAAAAAASAAAAAGTLLDQPLMIMSGQFSEEPVAIVDDPTLPPAVEDEARSQVASGGLADMSQRTGVIPPAGTTIGQLPDDNTTRLTHAEAALMRSVLEGPLNRTGRQGRARSPASRDDVPFMDDRVVRAVDMTPSSASKLTGDKAIAAPASLTYSTLQYFRDGRRGARKNGAGKRVEDGRPPPPPGGTEVLVRIHDHVGLVPAVMITASAWQRLQESVTHVKTEHAAGLSSLRLRMRSLPMEDAAQAATAQSRSAEASNVTGETVIAIHSTTHIYIMAKGFTVQASFSMSTKSGQWAVQGATLLPPWRYTADDAAWQEHMAGIQSSTAEDEDAKASATALLVAQSQEHERKYGPRCIAPWLGARIRRYLSFTKAAARRPNLESYSAQQTLRRLLRFECSHEDALLGWDGATFRTAVHH